MTTPFQHLYNVTVTIRRKTGADSWGKPTFGSPVTVPAKWRRADGTVIGTGILSDGAHIVHMSYTEVNIDDEMTLPDGSVHPVRGVRDSKLPGGYHVMEVTL